MKTQLSIHCGTYDGAMFGISGDMVEFKTMYAFNPENVFFSKIPTFIKLVVY